MSGAHGAAASAPVPIALTIAGSDSSGGAGIQADLKTFAAYGVYGASVLTAITAQNTRGVTVVHAVPPGMIRAQLAAVFDDLDVKAIKTGMVGNASAIRAVVAGLAPAHHVPLVVDPVMVATSGDILLEPDAIATLIAELIPYADLLTPNLPEAARLLGTREAASEADMIAQGEAIRALGAKAVLVKGGHGTGAEAVDVLVSAAGVARFAAPRVDTPHTHGTGCTLSAAIAAGLASGLGLTDAIARAKRYVTGALEAGRSLGVGKGHGPLDHAFGMRSAKTS